jgi:hypothetical protein
MENWIDELNSDGNLLENLGACFLNLQMGPKYESQSFQTVKIQIFKEYFHAPYFGFHLKCIRFPSLAFIFQLIFDNQRVKTSCFKENFQIKIHQPGQHFKFIDNPKYINKMCRRTKK